MDDIALYVGIVALVWLAIITSIIWIKHDQLKSVTGKASLQGIEFSAEFAEAVRREVRRAQAASLQHLLRLDEKLIVYWEGGKNPNRESALAALEALEHATTELESRLRAASPDERIDVGLGLREVYWQYLRHSRDAYASSPTYQKIRGRIIAGMKEIEKIASSLAAE